MNTNLKTVLSKLLPKFKIEPSELNLNILERILTNWKSVEVLYEQAKFYNTHIHIDEVDEVDDEKDIDKYSTYSGDTDADNTETIKQTLVELFFDTKK